MDVVIQLCLAYEYSNILAYAFLELAYLYARIGIFLGILPYLLFSSGKSMTNLHEWRKCMPRQPVIQFSQRLIYSRIAVRRISSFLL